MTRLTTKLFVVALSAASLTVSAAAHAGCHGGGGGGYGGYHGGYTPRVRTIRTVPQPQFQQPPQQFAQQPQQPQQFAQQPQQFAQQPQQPRANGQQQQPQGPSQQTPAQQGLGALGNTQQTPAANQQTAEMTALQALAAMGGNQAQAQPAQTQQPQQTQPQPQPQESASSNVGTWVAKVGSEATVRLDLRADGSFTWTATRSGKTSNFAGQYDISGGQLTLTRADNQKLAGDMTVSGNGFNFKLSGAKDAGLNFARG